MFHFYVVNGIIISIAPIKHNNYISVDFANEIVILNSNIGEILYLWNMKEYEITYTRVCVVVFLDT